MLNYLKQKLKEHFAMKTYSVGILQAQVYRALKKETNDILKDYSLSSFDWALLGILSESKQGENAVDLSDELDVSQAFISKIIKKLLKEEYIEIKKEKDARFRKIFLTEFGRKNLEKIEPILKNKMKVLLKGVVLTDLYGYVNTLKKIAENSLDKTNQR